MSAADMEEWWSLSPDDLAIVQADPHHVPENKAKPGKLQS